MAQTDQGKNLALAALIGDDHAPNMPSSWYIALMATAPDPGDTGADLDEPSPTEYPAYARVAVANDDTRWTIIGTNATNACPIYFPSSAASGGTVPVRYVALTDSPSAGAVVIWGPLPFAQTVGAASVLPRFVAGSLVVAASDPISGT